MTTIEIKAPDGDLSTYIATPEGEGPWPGVCVINDVLGMSQDLRNQADWLASEGYLTTAPDLFNGGTFLGCLRTIIRDFNQGEGPLFDRVEAVRLWLTEQGNCTGKVGVIGFWETRKNNDPKNQGGRGRIRTNHFSKPGNRSNRFSNSSIAFLVNLTPVQ